MEKNQLKDVVSNGESADLTVDNVFEDKEKPDKPAPRKKSLISRLYHGSMMLLFLLGTVMGIVSLGLFGVKYAEVVSFARQRVQDTPQVCILFATTTEEFQQSFSGVGLCGFVLSAHAAIIILALLSLIYNIVLIIIAPKILSPLRILDFVLMGLGVVVSFTVSVVVHAGLTRTCETFDTETCSRARLEFIDEDNRRHEVEFYNEIDSSKAILWIVTIGCILLTLQNGLLFVVYCIRASSRRRQEKLETYNPLEEEEQSKSNKKE